MVVRHIHKAVHHLRQQTEEDRETFAFIVACVAVAILFLFWVIFRFYLFPNSSVPLSAETAGAAATTRVFADPASKATDVPTSIDDAIYVRVPAHQ